MQAQCWHQMRLCLELQRDEEGGRGRKRHRPSHHRRVLAQRRAQLHRLSQVQGIATEMRLHRRDEPDEVGGPDLWAFCREWKNGITKVKQQQCLAEANSSPGICG